MVEPSASFPPTAFNRDISEIPPAKVADKAEKAPQALLPTLADREENPLNPSASSGLVKHDPTEKFREKFNAADLPQNVKNLLVSFIDTLTNTNVTASMTDLHGASVPDLNALEQMLIATMTGTTHPEQDLDAPVSTDQRHLTDKTRFEHARLFNGTAQLFSAKAKDREQKKMLQAIQTSFHAGVEQPGQNEPDQLAASKPLRDALFLGLCMSLPKLNAKRQEEAVSILKDLSAANKKTKYKMVSTKMLFTSLLALLGGMGNISKKHSKAELLDIVMTTCRAKRMNNRDSPDYYIPLYGALVSAMSDFDEWNLAPTSIRRRYETFNQQENAYFSARNMLPPTVYMDGEDKVMLSAATVSALTGQRKLQPWVKSTLLEDMLSKMVIVPQEYPDCDDDDRTHISAAALLSDKKTRAPEWEKMLKLLPELDSKSDQKNAIMILERFQNQVDLQADSTIAAAAPLEDREIFFPCYREVIKMAAGMKNDAIQKKMHAIVEKFQTSLTAEQGLAFDSAQKFQLPPLAPLSFQHES